MANEKELRPIQEVIDDIKGEFSTAEVSLTRSMKALWRMSSMFKEAYQNGKINGGNTLERRNSAVQLSAEIAELHGKVLKFHQLTIEDAAAAEIAISGDYGDLGPILVPQPKSGGGGRG